MYGANSAMERYYIKFREPNIMRPTWRMTVQPSSAGNATRHQPTPCLHSRGRGRAHARIAGGEKQLARRIAEDEDELVRRVSNLLCSP
jgi:hypothetical protein